MKDLFELILKVLLIVMGLILIWGFLYSAMMTFFYMIQGFLIMGAMNVL